VQPIDAAPADRRQIAVIHRADASVHSALMPMLHSLVFLAMARRLRAEALIRSIARVYLLWVNDLELRFRFSI
jgi:hypothetical protein